MKSYPAIGIRPIVDSRRLGIRDALEGKVREMAEAAKALIEQNVFYADGTPAKVVIFSGSIAGGEEAARCEQEFAAQHVTATLSVTPSWCYPLETIDLNPMTVKAIWGFNGTERPFGIGAGCTQSDETSVLFDLRTGCAGHGRKGNSGRCCREDPAVCTLCAGRRTDAE